jgi:DNA (cytosine-5)-methyltransferase 1
MTLAHLSLFSGIGGIDLAAEWAGFKTIAFCEIDKYCQQVLKKHWPDVPIIKDVKDVTKETIVAYAKESSTPWREWESRNDASESRGGGIDGNGSYSNDGCQIITDSTQRQDFNGETGVLAEKERCQQGINTTSSDGCGITLISGGFPCQPHSVAGKRKASADKRDLWPEFRRVIGEIKPRWVLAENVPGLFSSDAGRFFGAILNDLATLGYSVGWATYGAVDAGALHRRNRVFIIGHNSDSSEQGLERTISEGSASTKRLPTEFYQEMADSNIRRCQQRNEGFRGISESNTGSRPTESRMGNMANGFSGWLVEPEGVPRVVAGIKDRVNKLKALGNAVVPQQIYPILKAIAEMEANK